MKKLLIITYYWPPSGGPGVQRWLKFSNQLVQLGYELFVVTVDPIKATYPVTDTSLLNEVSDQVKVVHTSTLEPYALFKSLNRKKQVPYSGFTNEGPGGFISSLSRFLRGNLFIPDARRGWNRFALEKAAELIKEHHITTVITTSPPHSSQLVGFRLKKQFPQIRWIADLRDPWTDIFYYGKMLHLPFARNIDSRMEKQVLLAADHVITVSNYVKDLFLQKVPGASQGKFSVITNGFDPADFNLTETEKDTGLFTIAYVGTLSDEYNLDGFIEGLKRITLPDHKKLHIQFTGNISPGWREKLEKQFQDIISVSGHTDHKTAVSRMKQADLLLLVIPRIEQNLGIVTGKIFEYMATLNPILGIGPPAGDASYILNETATGHMFHYPDAEGIASFIQQVIDNPFSFQPNHDAINHYSRRQLAQRLAELF
jgi:glycosyltransferase involved in cell wall biosynthesis